MSHFAVLVIGNNVEEQLARYDENLEVPEYLAEIVSEEDKERFLKYYTEKKGIEGKTFEELYEEYGEDWNNNTWRKNEEGVWCRYSTYNPDSKWDWYSVGGRFSGNFITHVFDEDHESVNYGEMGVFRNKVGIDSTIKSNIDFKKIREQAYKEAYDHYMFVKKCFDGEIPKLEYTWAQILDKYPDMDNDKRREMYNNQDAFIRWKNKLKYYQQTNNKVYEDLIWLNLDNYQCKAEEYAKDKSDCAFVPFAVVKDGVWYERGKMGWWAIVSDEKDKIEWVAFVNKIIDEANDNELFTFVDCHI